MPATSSTRPIRRSWPSAPPPAAAVAGILLCIAYGAALLALLERVPLDGVSAASAERAGCTLLTRNGRDLKALAGSRAVGQL
jgi:hypothetical protein